MRLFIAMQIPENVRGPIASLQQEFRAIAPRLKWIRPENLHITLKFLGETNPHKLRSIEQTLAGIHSSQPVTLEFSGLGFFPSAKRPSVFWAGIKSSSNLQTLAVEIDNRMYNLGFLKEDRIFTPHLTLTRLDKTPLPDKLADAIAQNSMRHFCGFTTSEFHLVESKLKSTGAEYTTLQSFSFVVEA